ncbi:hypothetical protein HPB50_027458 [Hyalomma asiaticum]|uniref:Uncharacterized protein n=1 Tax=Hyalomma asiaticum TaxID=266040 RepID=A0ACB7TPN2_HYAAI|nr:hypothetical protein HPB50_027458 [Hyalomma asiaticum]
MAHTHSMRHATSLAREPPGNNKIELILSSSNASSSSNTLTTRAHGALATEEQEVRSSLTQLGHGPASRPSGKAFSEMSDRSPSPMSQPRTSSPPATSSQTPSAAEVSGSLVKAEIPNNSSSFWEQDVWSRSTQTEIEPESCMPTDSYVSCDTSENT